MPAYNLSSAIIDLTTGRPFTRNITAELWVRDAILASLLVIDNNNIMPPNERIARAELAERIGASKSLVELSDLDVQLVKHACLISAGLPFLHAILKALDEPITSLQ